MTLKDEVILAEAAKQVMDNAAFRKAVSDTDEALLYALRQSGMTDAALREKICAYYTLLHKLLDCLKSTMETGRFALSALELEEKQRSWLQRFKATA